MRTIRIYTDSHAALLVERAGQKYRPSNGSEGEAFFESWCSECQRDKAMREGAPLEDCDDNERCDIIGDTFAYSVDDPRYPDAWQYGPDGQPRCTAFVEAGQPIPEPKCERTRDMFEEVSA